MHLPASSLSEKMKIEHWSYINLNPDGTFAGDPNHRKGAVEPKPGLNTSEPGESRPWLSVSTGRLPDGTMHGITVRFSCTKEMREFELRQVVI
jgi:hypothetical protein